MLILLIGMVLISLVLFAREFILSPDEQLLMDRAYQQGVDAAQNHQSCFSNPYRGVVADMWADGFVAGKEALAHQEAICR
ncbi:hypothetical protein BCT63_20910 [Vibrio kanaloae]|uniref:Uncharacterized protein n=1 Tax=Vibrio sp. FF_307 TaxID=1652834 RepID=A0A0H4A131_9VIBR|nr:hypothetical protein [Vibrio kanaloae]AKN40622.1 hypothetical protein [Vibrio sp. FF_307]PMM09181.1 hypothetical protein BCT63_20910 [Vibrio kanaloae]TKF00210.1 hypothetical protein FCV44_03865 [Vibrio kanaloae]TKF17863.1 hypothetical protein FCV47_07560 [Vibrio kanaloae]TKF75393.1 hypothetical protein FCV62_20255 [Vibrio kanaloae]